MANTLMPDWMRAVSRFNPVNWAVEAGRGALQANATAPEILLRLACLAGFAVVSGWIAMRAFRAYQRSA